MWTSGTVRVTSMGQPLVVQGGTATCAPTGVPLPCRRDPAPGDGVMSRCPRFHPASSARRLDGRGRRPAADDERLPARPRRAGAVHPPRRARQPPGLRQRGRRASSSRRPTTSWPRPPRRSCTARCSAASATCSGSRSVRVAASRRRLDVRSVYVPLPRPPAGEPPQVVQVTGGSGGTRDGPTPVPTSSPSRRGDRPRGAPGPRARAGAGLDGIDFVEVLSNHARQPGPRRRRPAAAHAARPPAQRAGAAELDAPTACQVARRRAGRTRRSTPCGVEWATRRCRSVGSPAPGHRPARRASPRPDA